MVIKRNSYYNTGRFHRKKKNTKKQWGVEIHMDWSLYIVWDRSEYIVLAGLELTEVHFSQIFRFGPFLPVAAVFSGRLDILGQEWVHVATWTVIVLIPHFLILSPTVKINPRPQERRVDNWPLSCTPSPTACFALRYCRLQMLKCWRKDPQAAQEPCFKARRHCHFRFWHILLVKKSPLPSSKCVTLILI